MTTSSSNFSLTAYITHIYRKISQCLEVWKDPMKPTLQKQKLCIPFLGFLISQLWMHNLLFFFPYPSRAQWLTFNLSSEILSSHRKTRETQAEIRLLCVCQAEVHADIYQFWLLTFSKIEMNYSVGFYCCYYLQYPKTTDLVNVYRFLFAIFSYLYFSELWKVFP